MNKIEKVVYNIVKNNVKVKIVIKRIYQSFFLIFKPKRLETKYDVKIAEGYFFGFHDKNPWSNNDYLLAHKIDSSVQGVPTKEDCVEIGYFKDTELKEFKTIDKTKSWNWQQGAMLQWIGNRDQIMFNYWDGNQNVGKIVDLNGKRIKFLPYAVGAVSNDSNYIASYDFERLNRGMYGYGYANENKNIKTLDDNIPLDSGFRIFSIKENQEMLNISINEINNLLGERKLNGYLFVTHFLFSPNNERFLFLIRSYIKNRRLTSRMISCDIHGENIHIFPCGNMVSHITWVGSDKVLAYCSDINEKDGYYLFNDQDEGYKKVGEKEYTFDGHPQFNEIVNSIITDSYPNRKRLQELSIYNFNLNEKRLIGQFYSPVKFSNEFRCDLHPRWNKDGTKICIDTTYTGKRALGVIYLNKQI
ncbi:MAG: hypothetical protein JEY96_02065 [Bacteroidales bacterium]|nr:hypothetical protein [Bacteroidales bacterium]